MSDHHNENPENCTHDCSTCSENCEHATESLQQALRPGARVDKVIAVVSGKGGVGKSLVTSLLACEMQRRGHQAAVLDADITGPSIPQAFGVHGGAMGGEDFLYPNRTRTGIEIMSINLLLPNETDPVVWRGPVIAGAVTQFWTDVQWENVNYMFVDMPPGTGDVPLTVFQSLPVAGVVVVTSPQELVGMIVDKAVNMADMMHVPVLGIDHKILSMGYNGLPTGCSDDEFPWGREGDPLENKYLFTTHSELNAILNYRGGSLEGSTIYVSLFPCNECAKAIIQAGIKRIVYDSDKYDGTPSVIASKRMLTTAGVTLQKYVHTNREVTIVL